MSQFFSLYSKLIHAHLLQLLSIGNQLPGFIAKSSFLFELQTSTPNSLPDSHIIINLVNMQIMSLSCLKSFIDFLHFRYNSILYWTIRIYVSCGTRLALWPQFLSLHSFCWQRMHQYAPFLNIKGRLYFSFTLVARLGTNEQFS